MFPSFDTSSSSSSSLSPRFSTSRFVSSSTSYSTLRSAPSANFFRSINPPTTRPLPPATQAAGTIRPVESTPATARGPRQALIVGSSLSSPPPSSNPTSPSTKSHRESAKQSPSIKTKSFPLTPLSFPDTAPRPALEFLTPTYLRHLRNANPERPMFLRGVTPAAFDEWESRFPDNELREADDLRYEFDSVMERLIIKCMPGPIHDSLQIYFVRRIMEEAVRTNSTRRMTVASGTDCTGFTGEWATNSKKLPDAYVQVGTDDFPTVVAEAGWSEDLQDLIEDARMWLLGTDRQTKVVILIEFEEVKAIDDVTSQSDPEPDIETPEGADSEAALLASLNGSTAMKSVAKRLLSLHNENKIATPLLGTIHATMHVYRLDPTTDTPSECFTAVVLPVPEGPELAFSLTMEDIFGNVDRVPDGVAPDHEIVFDLDELREVIGVQVPKMEWNRAVARAKKLLEQKGLFEGKDTFAVGKSLKRKEREAGGQGDADGKRVRGD